MLKEPQRGFPHAEYEARAEKARALMARDGLDAVVVTSPHNVRYFSGFATQFWESPTRPWFLIVPRTGTPVAVVPEIGAPGFVPTWIDDIRTWPAPQPQDDGVSLLASALEALPRSTGKIGWEMGRESVIRMPISDFDTLRAQVSGLEFVNASPLIWALRMVKSEREVGHIRYICQLASHAFEALPSRLQRGDSELLAARKLSAELIARGADSIPFIAACSGPGGYDQIIVGSRPRPLDDGDILFIDLGALFDGYSCDFDRNFAFARLSDEAARAHEAVWHATEEGIAAARPGATTTDLFNAMARVLEENGSKGLNVGRLGHGLGMQLTEPPSNMPGDETELVPGMVMTIEPGMEYAPGKMIVHEENVVITEDGCELLTRRAQREMPVIT
ncbi:MAG: Xaa-Pro peptidase family protein [Pseudomonadota bacterium]